MRKRLLHLAMMVSLLLVIPASATAHVPYLWLPSAFPALAATPDTAPGMALDATLDAAAGMALDTALDGPYTWPVDGPIVGPFDPPSQPWLPGHRGVDISAPAGSLVRAAAGGIVRFAGQVASRPLVSITHPNGTRTTYEPVQPTVSAGDAVSAGDVIGTLLVGHPGCANACLHWGLRLGDTYLDPLSLLGLGRVRLLPASTPERVS